MTSNPPLLKDISSLMSLIGPAKAELCRRDLFFFVQTFWDIVIDETPVWNWHIPYLCNELQLLAFRMMERKPKLYDLIINIPPGTTKSTIATVMFPSWCWIARHPHAKNKYENRLNGSFFRFITGSYAEALALEHADYSRDIIKSDRYKSMFPEIGIRRDKDLKSNYKIFIKTDINSPAGNRFSTSVGSSATGVHAHFIIIDDPVNPAQALSDAKRKTSNAWMDHTLSTRKVDKRMTVSILIMQRLHKMDCTGHMLSKKTRGKKIKHIILPGTTEYKVQPTKLKQNYVDGLLDPVRLGEDSLSDMKVDLGSYGFSGQVGQDPKPREGGMFQEDYFEVVESVPEGGTRWVRGWDLAATTERESSSASYTACVKMKYAEGIFYIGHAFRFRGSPHAVRNKMLSFAKIDEPGTVIDFPQDPGQAGKAQARDLASYLAKYEVRYSTESGDKELRAEPFSAQCEAGNVKLLLGNWNIEYLDEAGFFPNGFKDQIDASVRAFNRVLILRKAGSDMGNLAPTGFKNYHNSFDEEM